ncbi:hypothetical protein Nepgr_016609 [Nepenthes gracilis]|uniref:Phosphoglycerate mutase n=1 Tax=Nepenthes gracilis TaxID=150966 RepID=A0AAD3SNW9_NEPGR|nr:hypothetical protein Nepgr_016609 [Nepenthes gracilis]
MCTTGERPCVDLPLEYSASPLPWGIAISSVVYLSSQTTRKNTQLTRSTHARSHCLSLVISANSSMAETNFRVSLKSVRNGNDNGSCTDPSYTEIILVRHGETEWNALGKLQGQLDVDLNDVGRQQAAAVAVRLSKEPNISVVYSSDLKRALETAEIIAARCGGLQVVRDQDLRERHLGDLQGLVYQPQELIRLKPEVYRAFISHKMDQTIPGGGESLDQLYHRCTSSLQRIGEKHRGERLIVVSHGGVIRSLYGLAALNCRRASAGMQPPAKHAHILASIQIEVKSVPARAKSQSSRRRKDCID